MTPQRQGALTLLVQGAACLGGAGIGLALAQWLVVRGVLTEPINLLYLMVLGLLCGYLFSRPLVRSAQGLRSWAQQLPPDAVLAAGIGSTCALFATVLLNSVLERVPGFSWQLSLLLTCLLVSASSWFAVVNRNFFAPHALRAPPLTGAGTDAGAGSDVDRGVNNHRLKVIDTSAVIDGRVAEVAAANFLSGTLLLPRFALSELQRIADSDDPNRRKRGRRGLEVLEQLKSVSNLRLEIVTDDFEDASEVDAKLVHLCRARRAALITTDFNLGRVASLEGIEVLNLHALASALKTNLVAGETLPLQIIKAGREPGQGLAYLDDGTMVVVEGAATLVGKTVQTVVTSHLQTSVGRMIFAKLEA